MTALEQLQRLSKQFPNSEGLAVSEDMALQYEAEMATLLRLGCYLDINPYLIWPTEKLRTLSGHILARRLALNYRDRYLVLVEPS